MIFQTASEKSPQVETNKLFNNLSFSHFVELIYIDNPLKRVFYEIETIKGCWSVKELHRQIESLCYERSNFRKLPDKLLASYFVPTNLLTLLSFIFFFFLNLQKTNKNIFYSFLLKIKYFKI